MLKRVYLLAILCSSLVLAQRVCQSPDALFVDSSSNRFLTLNIFVPPTTSSFTLAIYDQADEEEVSQPSSFTLYYPDGSLAERLQEYKKGEWSQYGITTMGKWGVWRLSISGPQAPSGAGTVRNFFIVRTEGDVDLYVKMEPRARVRFAPPHFGSQANHIFTIQIPPIQRVRFNFLRPKEANNVKVSFESPKKVSFKESWGGLGRGSVEFCEIKGKNLEGVWKLVVSDVTDFYSIGIEQELRLFFTDSPIIKFENVYVKTFEEGSNTPIPARIDITSPQTLLESYVQYTDAEGHCVLSLIPDVLYTITFSRGFEYEPYQLMTTAEVKSLSIGLRRRLKRPLGWYCGDTHTHTIYSDGNDTPLQMVEAGMGEGLDWIVLTDHAVGPNIQHLHIAHKEGMSLSREGEFVVIPGEEFSTTYHANIINGTVKENANSSLSDVVRVVRRMNRQGKVVAIKLNHPYWGGTPKAPEIARQTPLLPLLEIWNDDGPKEPQSAYLLWELLNKGWKIFGDTATDTHNRKSSKVGARRTYVYLGNLPLTADNVTKALLNGHSFISRGALIFLSINGKIPGETTSLVQGEVTVRVEVDSISPIDRIELVNNGKVFHTIPLGGMKMFSGEFRLQLQDGWVIAQVMEKDSAFPLAMTNPIFIKKGSSL
ncbi:CehA/McbA family metallohydrolase [bacterium]|nr:CehA/McbA family metallohydrolase [bacterium]